MHIKDRHKLENILDAIEKIESYTVKFKDADEFYAQNLEFDAEEVWQIIYNKIPELKNYIKSVI